MKTKVFSALTAFAGALSFLTSSAFAANRPYDTVLVASAINYCASEYGLVTRKQAYKMTVDWVKDKHNLEPYQVYNLMARENIGKDVSKLIGKWGGCEVIAADLKKSLDSKPSGISGLMNSKKDYEYFYNVR